MAAEPPLRPAAGYCLGRRRPRWRRPETTSKGRQHSLPRRAFVVLLGTAAAAAPRPRSAEASPAGGQSSGRDQGGERDPATGLSSGRDQGREREREIEREREWGRTEPGEGRTLAWHRAQPSPAPAAAARDRTGSVAPTASAGPPAVPIPRTPAAWWGSSIVRCP